MTGLIRNSTITYLDVSHNKITNHGEGLSESKSNFARACQPADDTTIKKNEIFSIL